MSRKNQPRRLELYSLPAIQQLNMMCSGTTNQTLHIGLEAYARIAGMPADTLLWCMSCHLCDKCTWHLHGKNTALVKLPFRAGGSCSFDHRFITDKPAMDLQAAVRIVSIEGMCFPMHPWITKCRRTLHWMLWAAIEPGNQFLSCVPATKAFALHMHIQIQIWAYYERFTIMYRNGYCEAQASVTRKRPDDCTSPTILRTPTVRLMHIFWLYLSVSDAFPIGGYRRKPYLFIAGVLGFISWILMWCAVDGVWSGFACMLIGSMAIAIAVRGVYCCLHA